MPTVSVIIPTFNRAHLVRQAVRSILDQTYQDFEIIVVDDGSTDETRTLLEAFGDRLQYIFQANGGASVARNTGLQMAKGDFVAFLDSDDTFLPHKLECQVAALAADATIGLVAGGIQHVDELGTVVHVERGWLAAPDISLRTILLMGLSSLHAVLVRREWLVRVGGFDPNLPAGEDMDLWYQLALAGCKMNWMPILVGKRLIHAENISQRFEWHFSQTLRALNKVWADTRLPRDLLFLRPQVEAQVYVTLAGRCFCVQDWAAGQWAIAQAVSTDPSLTDNQAARLAELIIGWPDSPWFAGGQGSFQQLVQYLPHKVRESGVTASRLESLRAKKVFWGAYAARNYRAVPAAWREVAGRELTWWFDRGGWSILLRSLGHCWLGSRSGASVYYDLAV